MTEDEAAKQYRIVRVSDMQRALDAAREAGYAQAVADAATQKAPVADPVAMALWIADALTKDPS